MEQVSDFSIDACECCGEFHRVAWYDADEDGECLLCDKCLEMYEFEEVIGPRFVLSGCVCCLVGVNCCQAFA